MWHSYAPEPSCSQSQETCCATHKSLLNVNLCQVCLSGVFLVSVAGGGYSDLWQRSGDFLKAAAGDICCVLKGDEVLGGRGLSVAVDPLGIWQEGVSQR